ncbi:Os05g0189425, partial [Oryza sativa Japonica Group]
ELDAGRRSSSSVAFSCTVSDVPEESAFVEEGSEVFVEAQEEEYFSEGDDLKD